METSLGIVVMALFVGALFYSLVRELVAHPKEVLADFRREPVFATLAWLGLFGMLTFFLAVVSMGALAFEVETPWGSIDSQ